MILGILACGLCLHLWNELSQCTHSQLFSYEIHIEHFQYGQPKLRYGLWSCNRVNLSYCLKRPKLCLTQTLTFWMNPPISVISHSGGNTLKVIHIKDLRCKHLYSIWKYSLHGKCLISGNIHVNRLIVFQNSHCSHLFYNLFIIDSYEPSFNPFSLHFHHSPVKQGTRICNRETCQAAFGGPGWFRAGCQDWSRRPASDRGQVYQLVAALLRTGKQLG